MLQMRSEGNLLEILSCSEEVFFFYLSLQLVAWHWPTLCRAISFTQSPLIWTLILSQRLTLWDFPGGSDSKNKQTTKQTNKQKNGLQCRRPGFDPWVRKIPLEKGMASRSSILAWRISWTEESGRVQSIQSMGSQEVRHDWVTSTFTFFLIPKHLHTLRVTFIQISKNPIREGNDTPLQYSCLENPMDKGAW